MKEYKYYRIIQEQEIEKTVTTGWEFICVYTQYNSTQNTSSGSFSKSMSDGRSSSGTIPISVGSGYSLTKFLFGMTEEAALLWKK